MRNLAISLLLFSSAPAAAESTAAVKAATAPAQVAVSSAAVRAAILADRKVRGIHLTCWGAGSARSRRELIQKISGTVLNTVVVAVKETDGRVYIPGVAGAEAIGAYEAAISDPEKMVKEFKDAGLYTVARVVVFKDKVLPKKRPALGVKTPGGDLWRSRNGAVWADQYSREVWDYNIDVAIRAAKAGFEEIQFDYIRYPSEGNTSLCRYSKPHNMKTAMDNLGAFLRYARQKLAPYNVRISADVFGLTTSSNDDMGIGQDLRVLAENADYVYPMMYPSHYYAGQYGLKNPNSQPFKVINRGLKDASGRLGMHYARVRPYLQDFSLGWTYGPAEVRAQLIATRLNMLESWVLWHPANKYTWSALTPQSYRALVDPEYGYDGKE